jgi:tetratricopeptide (TPR) repeat protein
VGDSDDELPDDIYEKVTDLSERGNLLLDAGHPDSAIEVWNEALALLPHPQKKWEAGMWLHASLGQAYRDKGDLTNALSHLQSAHGSADGHLNPFVLISLGATLYDLGRPEEAADHLLRAYMLEGKGLFDEFGGPYLGFLRSRKLAD